MSHTEWTEADVDKAQEYGAKFDVNTGDSVDEFQRRSPTLSELDKSFTDNNGAFELTDAGNAERMAHFYGGYMRYCGALGRWLVWNNHQWKFDDTGEADRRALATLRRMKRIATDAPDKKIAQALWHHAHRCESDSKIKSMLARAKSLRELTILPEQLDAEPMLLNVTNGTIDLRTGELRPHNRADLLTKLAPVAYDADAVYPQWQSFLNRIMDGNETLIGYLQRIAGLCLTAEVTVQELYIFHGGGANGKSVWLDTFAGLLGDYAGEAAPSLLTMRSHDEHACEFADLTGKRLVIASETEEGARLRVQVVKRLTGNARIKGRFMRQDFFEFDRTHKLVLVSNNRPSIREATNAIWRRIKLVPFNVTIPPDEQDAGLLAKLRGEWPGILAWAVRGCLDWQRDGMQTPAEVDIATQNYQSEQDPLADYLADRCVRGGDVKVSRGDLFNDYQSWAHQTGEKNPVERTAFFERVRKVAGVTDDQWKPAGTTVPVRGFRGVGLLHFSPEIAG